MTNATAPEATSPGRGVVAVDQPTRDDLVGEHLGLARHLARRFSGKGEPVDDLEQVAYLGLILAAERFDPDRGFRFASFAAPTITGELKRHLRDKGWGARVPRRLKELNQEVNAAVLELTHEHGRSPTIPEIAARVGATEEEVLEASEAGHAYRPASLDRPTTTEDRTSESVVARLGADDPGFGRVDEVVDLLPALDALSARDHQLLRLRFFDELSQREIGERMGVSQVHVSRLLDRCLKMARAVAAGTDVDRQS